MLTFAYRYPGTVDPVSQSVGPTPEWVLPSTTTALEVERHCAADTQPLDLSLDQAYAGGRVAPPRVPSAPGSSGATSSLGEHHHHALALAGRSESASGGLHVVLDEGGSWSGLADRSPPAPRPRPSGMLGFMKRRGRAASPKLQERGVLGREGARVVIA